MSAVTVQVDVRTALASVDDATRERVLNALIGGLHQAGDETAPQVWLSARHKGMNQVTGQLGAAVTAWPVADDEFGIFIGVPPESPADKYAYLLTEEVKTIVPIKGEYLAIPVEFGRTGAGAARFSSPRQLAGGEFVRGKMVDLPWGGVFTGLSFGLLSPAGYDPFFVMLKKVRVQGADVLEPTIVGAAPDMAETIQQRVDEELAR